MAIEFRVPVPFTKEMPEGGKHFHVLAWRKVFWFSLDLKSLFVGFHGEHLSDYDMKWHTGAGYHLFSIHLGRWEWGRTHDYYDGPHDSFSLGCFHVNWQGNWCEKCANGDAEE